MGPQALSGVTVVALEQAVAAPFATRQLADWGSRVIKIERPGTGDFARHYDETVHGQSSHFVWINRGKESLTLDVKSPDGQKILRQLMGQADVLVQNLKPGSLEKMGWHRDAIRRDFPKLIYCNISGYGPDGPYYERKAYDLLIQAESGLLSITGTEESPAKVGVSIGDIAAGMYALTSILMALIHRNQTHEGTIIDVSMLEALAEWMGDPLNFGQFS
jgi:itaconate CoA-transferase